MWHSYRRSNQINAAKFSGLKSQKIYPLFFTLKLNQMCVCFDDPKTKIVLFTTVVSSDRSVEKELIFIVWIYLKA